MFFVRLLEEYFQEAVRQQGSTHRRFNIAGRPVIFEFSGGRWRKELGDAFAHLERDPFSDSHRGLTVAIWDGATQPANHVLRGYLFAMTNWWFDYTNPRGQLLDVHSADVAAGYHPDTGTLSVVDHQRQMAFYWKRDTSAVPYFEACAPLRSLLHAWMREASAQFVHGAAVGTERGGVLLVGKGGSGKSTSALACLGSTLRYAGDDYCVVTEDSGAFAVHSLYSTAKVVEMADLDRFPSLARDVLNPVREPGEKVAVSLAERHAGKLIERFPLRAILVPMITEAAETQMVRCSPSEALMAIAPSTLSQLPFSGSADLRFLGRMAHRVPCYRVLLGRDIDRIPAKLLALLESLAEGGSSAEEALVTASPAG